MLQIIGLIIGLYVEVRMLELLGSPSHLLIKGAAAMNMGLTGLLMVALLVTPSTALR